ncbi:MAG: leucine-rich repeat protein, partial [Clostridiales bacterium]|nr:leucine-rich repeat protein [Clostridiales bacterium]
FVWNPDSGTVGSPSTYAAALSVASISGVKSSYLYANDSDVIFFTESNSITGKRNNFVNELYESQNLDDDEIKVYEYITVPGYGTRDNYYDVDVTGKIALVRRGESSFEDKALRAKNAGAVACIIYNNIEGTISMSMGKSDHIPTISITKEMGDMLASQPSGTIAVSKKYTAGPFMSDFSSWGPTPDLELKPEITAHGGEIKSSVPGGGYDNLSGTSMASPNLCGVAVLVRQYLKEKFDKYTQQQIVVLANQMLMSTATIVLDENGNPYSPRKQGAGLASLSNVVNTKAYLSVDGKDRTKLELLDDPKKTGKYNMNFNVVNISDSDVEYDLSVVGMTETVSTSDKDHVAEKDCILGGSFKARIDGNGTLRNNKLKVKAGATVKISVDYSLSSADKKMIDTNFPNGMYVEGFVKLTATDNDGIDLNIPFLAFYGDWTRAPIFDKTFYDVESEAHDGSIDEEDKIKADYYATTPYGSYYNNYVIPLGSYLYKIPAGYDPIPGSYDHISVGESSMAIDGFYAVYAGLLRNCKTMTYTIVDKLTGEVIHTYTDMNALKSFSNGGSPLPSFERLEWKSSEFGFINNREYEFKMVGLLDYGDGGLTTNLNNTFKFDFTFDNEAPVIKSVLYEKEYDRTTKKDRYYLTMTVYDNHYVQAITPIVFNEGNEYTMVTEQPIPVYSEKGKESKVRFEITDLLKDSVYDAMFVGKLGFAIDDYALNTNIYICQLPGTDGTLKFTNNGEPDAGTKSAVTVHVDEIVDLTQFLSTTDSNVDDDKDYLKYLTWTVGDESIAQVQYGQVRGITAGKRTQVTVTDTFGRSATITVNVREREAAATVEETALGTSDVKNGGVLTSSTNDVEDVSKEGVESLRFTYFETLFSYLRSGQTSMLGDTGSRKFISSVTGRLEMYPGEKIKLAYEIQPWYVADRYPIEFTSSNSSIATVDQDGVITALQKGDVNIRLSLEGSTRIATLSITVNSEFIIENRTLVAYKGLGGDVVIPDDEGIMYIGSYAFCLYEFNDNNKVTDDDYDANKEPGSNNTVTSVIIPDGVEEIQKYAFYNCTALKSVEIKGHVKFIRDCAFQGDTNLEEINLDDVYSIGRYAFKDCVSLDNVNLTQTYAIGEYGFENCVSLSSLDLTALRNTGTSAFEGCVSLKEVVLTENTKLAKRMFVGCGLEEVDVYEKVEIPELCFANCDILTRATIHNNLVAVGAGAFSGCTGLETFEFKGTVRRIDNLAFGGCTSLESFALPNNEVVLGSNIFYGCENLETIKLGKDTVIADISAALFEGTNLYTIEVDGDNNVYMVSADKSLLLTKSKGSNDFDTIVFAAHSLTNTYTIAADSTYKYIATGAFGGTQITKLVINKEGMVIGDYAFASCAKLQSVVLPAATGTAIGNNAFDSCAALKTVEN